MKKTILTILLLAFCVSISGAGITDQMRRVIAAKNAAAPPAGPWTDDFNRDNEDPLSTNWSNLATTGLSLVSNVASGVAEEGSYYTGSSLAANQYIQIAASAGLYNVNPYLYLRTEGTLTTGIYVKIAAWNSVSVHDASDDATLGAISTDDLSGAGTWKASIEGTGASKTVRFYLNGSEQGTAISSISEGPDAAGYVGVYTWGAGTSIFDDFECGDL